MGAMNRTGLRIGAAALLALAGCSGAESDGCASDSECPAGMYCDGDSGECGYDCTFDEDCADGRVCSARGRCQPGCRKTNGGLEDCDGLDNDCDGETDEQLAPEPCQRENEHGRCAGMRSCIAAVWICDAATPAAETCDGEDNDCDGSTDEQLDRQACELDEGVCTGTERECLGADGWSDCDYGPDYELDAETLCDGLDNDCDGLVDEQLGPLNCSLDQGVCAAALQYCLGADGWSDCDYGPDHEADDETRCDGLDNDCDGQTDEGLPPDYSRCEVGPLAGDGLDNNCDGLIDEPGGCMVQIPGRPVWIDVYEATLFGASDCSGRRYGENADDYPPGFPDIDADPTSEPLYACAVPDRVPSSHLTWYQARRACAAQGKRLCTKAEWAAACGGDFPEPQDFPYGDAFEPGVCADFTVNPDEPIDSGTLPACISPAGAFDMSGNLFEWVDDTCEWDDTRKAVQGGSYLCEVCDPQDNCAPCDLDDPDHQDAIRTRYYCMHTDQPWWCAGPTGSWNSEGSRCCWDGP